MHMDVYSHFPPISSSSNASGFRAPCPHSEAALVPSWRPWSWANLLVCSKTHQVIIQSLEHMGNGGPFRLGSPFTKKNNENWVFHRDRVSVFPDKYWGPYWGLSKAFHEPSLNQICWTATLSLMKYIYIQYIYTLPSCFEAPYVFMNDYITL
jgi:hypothetical protein